VSEPTPYRWRDEFLKGGRGALAAGKGTADVRDRQIEKLREDLVQGDQVIEELTIPSASGTFTLRPSFRPPAIVTIFGEM
jgi:hypothetical protein